jgi:hypothetical protein
MEWPGQSEHFPVGLDDDREVPPVGLGYRQTGRRPASRRTLPDKATDTVNSKKAPLAKPYASSVSARGKRLRKGF